MEIAAKPSLLAISKRETNVEDRISFPLVLHLSFYGQNLPRYSYVQIVWSVWAHNTVASCDYRLLPRRTGAFAVSLLYLDPHASLNICSCQFNPNIHFCQGPLSPGPTAWEVNRPPSDVLSKIGSSCEFMDGRYS